MEKLYERIAQANESAMTAFDRAAEEKDAARSEELLAEGTKHAEEAKRLEKIATKREEASASAERAEARRLSETPERSFEREGAEGKRDTETGWVIPTEAELESRSVAIASVQARGLTKVPESLAARAAEEFPVEELFLTSIRSRYAEQRGRDPILVGKDREAWKEYCERARRVQQRLSSPLTGGQVADSTQNFGSDMVPETWANIIVSNMAYYGPMADTSMLRLFNNDSVGQFHVATVTDNETKKARILAEATASTKDRVTTSEVTLTPRNTVVQIPITDQMMMSGNINLRGFLMTDVPEWFGRAINEWYTTGDGANKPTGLTRVAAAGNTERIATRGTILEEEVYDWVGELDKAYLDQPNTSIQMHWTTVLYLMRQRTTNGERLYPLTADRRSVLIPPAGTVTANNALAANGSTTATAYLGILGNLRAYGALMLGPMNVETQRNLESFQTLLSWSFFQDGKTLNAQEFAFLQNV